MGLINEIHTNRRNVSYLITYKYRIDSINLIRYVLYSFNFIRAERLRLFWLASETELISYLFTHMMPIHKRITAHLVLVLIAYLVNYK